MADAVFRADTSAHMSAALLLVLTYARKSESDFTFGPRSLERLNREGLMVSGQDIDDLLDKLREVEGLTEE